jgi:hypothetical protein
MKAQSLKLVQTESDIQVEQIDIKALMEKVDNFQHKLGNEISVLYHQIEDLEIELNKIIEGTDSCLKLEVSGAWQQVLKAKANLQIFFKNR